MSQSVAVSVFPANSSQASPPDAATGRGQAAPGSESEFAHHLAKAGQSSSPNTRSHASLFFAPSGSSGHELSLSHADQHAEQMTKVLAELLHATTQGRKTLQEAMDSGDIDVSLIDQVQTTLQQTKTEDVQPLSLQKLQQELLTAAGQGQESGLGGEETQVLSNALSALLRQTGLKGQNFQAGTPSLEQSQLLSGAQEGGQSGIQGSEPEMTPELRQALHRLQSLLGRGQGPDSQAGPPSLELSQLLSAAQKGGQSGIQGSDPEMTEELRQALHRLQSLLGRGQGQGPNSQAGTQSLEQSQLLSGAQKGNQSGIQGMDSEMTPELRQALHRLQSLLGRGEGQGPNSQAGTQSLKVSQLFSDTQQGNQSGIQNMDLEMTPELRQALHRLQSLLGRMDGAGEGSRHQIANAEKVPRLGDGMQGISQNDMRTSQAIVSPQPVSSQPIPARGTAYYLQSYQEGEQARPEASARVDSMPAAAEGRTDGGNKEGLTGQGRSSWAEAMLLQTGSGGKGQGQVGTGLKAQFGLSTATATDAGTASMGGNPTSPATLPGSANAPIAAGQGFTPATGTQQVFEQSMVDQVRFRLSQGLRSGQQEVVVRMHPRELGEVRLSLTSDDGNLRAHLHVQSQQVQDVLERNMPRLREALAEQGIEVDNFIFSSGEQEQESEYRTFEQEKWAGGRSSDSWSTMPEASEMQAGKKQAGYSSEQGLSVRI